MPTTISNVCPAVPFSRQMGRHFFVVKFSATVDPDKITDVKAKLTSGSTIKNFPAGLAKALSNDCILVFIDGNSTLGSIASAGDIVNLTVIVETEDGDIHFTVGTTVDQPIQFGIGDPPPTVIPLNGKPPNGPTKKPKKTKKAKAKKSK